MKRFMAIFFLAIFSICGFAEPNYEAAKDLVKKSANELIGELAKNKDKLKSDPTLASKFATKIIVPHFDFKYMSRSVLGTHWKKANDTQKDKFATEFQRLLVNTYAESMSEFSDQKVIVKSFKKSTKKPSDVTVYTEIKQPTGSSFPIDYRMRNKNGVWKVIDVRIEEVSLVRNYRSAFARDIRTMGMDGLIKKLTQKNNGKKDS